MADGNGTLVSLIALLGGHIALPTRCVCYCASPTCAGVQAPAPAAQPVAYGTEPPPAA